MFPFKKRLNNVEIDKSRLPAHIAIIMDGNGRWAKRRGMPRNIGHREGTNALRRIVHKCNDIGIKYLTVYAFSTENWNRPQSEVNTLMDLLYEFLKNADKEIAGRNVRIRVIGDDYRLTDKIKEEIARVQETTKSNDGMNLIIALNYGGRSDIVHAVRNIAEQIKSGEIKPEEICEDTIEQKLYTYGIPDPDLLIRTSGEQRTSNFLIWQLAYTEFWFTKTLWPDFKEEHLFEAILNYQNRDRRYGGV
ncbi:MAG: isoprenyl transferase [Bacillota bacterium]|nr:isoprenyl transferase [Bacillota bacterium]